MFGTNKNALGKIEKNQKVKEGECIFPFKYKGDIYNECYKGKHGDWCATEVDSKVDSSKVGRDFGVKESTFFCFSFAVAVVRGPRCPMLSLQRSKVG